MRYCNRVHRLFLCCLLVSVVTLTVSPARGQSLYGLFKDAACCGRFVMPSHDELAEARLMFELLLAGKKDTKAFARLLGSLGMEMIAVTGRNASLAVIREKEERKTGRGFYIINEQTDAPRYLMTPHAFTDIHTGRIAIKLAELGGFTLVALNTEKRYVTENGVKFNQDLARLSGTYFTALSRAMAKLTTHPEIVQLHGYGQAKRKTAEGRETDVIVSSGQRILRPAARRLADCLLDAIPCMVRAYPDEVSELGGTTNVTGKIVRKAGQDGFIHVELSKPLRNRLYKDSKLLQEFNRCLTDRP